MTLPKRILSASTDAEAREVLRELATAVRGSMPYPMGRMLSADAYLSAAEMLVPDGEAFAVLGNAPGMCVGAFGDIDADEAAYSVENAPTAWQALAAAIAKRSDLGLVLLALKDCN